MDDVARSFYLPRLPRVFYQGSAVVHWQLSMANRQTGWLTPEFHSLFREILLHTCVRNGLVCPAYCLMPDHSHVVLMGMKLKSDQLVAMAFLRTYLSKALNGARLQHQAYDHVLRDHERLRNAFARTCGYILENAMAAGLVSRPEEWPYSGAMVPGYPILNPSQPDYWRKFWQIYSKAKDPLTAKMKRPPFPGTIGTHPAVL